MGIWGDVIFQPQPDLPDTSPVTVRLQKEAICPPVDRNIYIYIF